MALSCRCDSWRDSTAFAAVPFLAAHGFDMPLLFRQLFQNSVSAFFGMDVIVSSLVLWLFVFSEGRRRGMRTLKAMPRCFLFIDVALVTVNDPSSSHNLTSTLDVSQVW